MTWFASAFERSSSCDTRRLGPPSAKSMPRTLRAEVCGAYGISGDRRRSQLQQVWNARLISVSKQPPWSSGSGEDSDG